MAKKKENKMGYMQLRAEESFVKKVKAKAGLIPVSKVIRRLLEKWLAGEVNLD